MAGSRARIIDRASSRGQRGIQLSRGREKFARFRYSRAVALGIREKKQTLATARREREMKDKRRQIYAAVQRKSARLRSSFEQ